MKPHLPTPNLLEAQRLTEVDEMARAGGRKNLLARAHAELAFMRAKIASPRTWPSTRINRQRAADLIEDLIAAIEPSPGIAPESESA